MPNIVLPAPIPDASATVRGAVNTSTQTFAGNKTYSGTLTASNGVVLATSTTQPTASSTTRGQLWIVQGGSGQTDQVYCCLKSADGTYAWQPISSESGWVTITNVAVPGGAVSAQTWQDAAHTVLQAVTVSAGTFNLSVSASWPIIDVNGTTYTLTSAGGYYSGTVSVTVSGTSVLWCRVRTPTSANGAAVTLNVTYVPPPSILTLAFSGGYPGSQTSVKAGDVYTVSGTTDVACTGIEVLAFEAGASQFISFASTTSFSVPITIGATVTSPTPYHARIRAKNAAGAYGATTDTAGTITCDNLYATATIGTITYPSTQSALKNSETATIAMTVANLGLAGDTINYTSPNGDLSVTSPTTPLVSGSKTVTRIAGSYNISTTNFRCTATRASNGAVTVSDTVINIANVAPTITVTVPYARLRSGGADGTSVQGYTVTISSDQQLTVAPVPSMTAGGGTWAGGGFTGGPSVWTRTLNVSDSGAKGTFSFTGLSCAGLSNIAQTVISSGASYVIGGFVPRDVTFAAFANTATIGVAVTTYTKLQAGIFTATNQASALNGTQGNTSNLVNTYTVTALSANPTTVYWNDATAASTNSGGTAKLMQLEEIV